MADILIVTPVLNDWQSLGKLISVLAEQSKLQSHTIDVLCVDDGSKQIDLPGDFVIRKPIRSVKILQLQANQGHQRAIALGLAYAHDHIQSDLLVVMDSDGEDRPEDLPDLIHGHMEQPNSIIVAERQRRSEGLGFKLFYQVYKLMFALMTGRPISFGNYSLIPAARLSNVIFNDGIWNNFAATLLKSRIPIKFVGTHRGDRYFGSSKMNFTSLMIHGLSAISVYTDIVIGRIIAFLTATSVAVAGIVIGVVYMKFATNAFVPGYATYVILFAVVLLAVALFTGVMTILSLLANRQHAATFPTRLIDVLIKDILEVSTISDHVFIKKQSEKPKLASVPN